MAEIPRDNFRECSLDYLESPIKASDPKVNPFIEENLLNNEESQNRMCLARAIYIICWAQCKIKLFKHQGLKKLFLLFSTISLSFILVFYFLFEVVFSPPQGYMWVSMDLHRNTWPWWWFSTQGPCDQLLPSPCLLLASSRVGRWQQCLERGNKQVAENLTLHEWGGKGRPDPKWTESPSPQHLVLLSPDTSQTKHKSKNKFIKNFDIVTKDIKF